METVRKQKKASNMQYVSNLPDYPDGEPIAGLDRDVAIIALCEITPWEDALCRLALGLLLMYREKHPFVRSLGCNVALTDQEIVPIREKRPGIMGICSNYAFIFLHRIRAVREHFDQYFLFVLFEEICHSVYATQNEYLVKEIVADTLDALDKYCLRI